MKAREHCSAGVPLERESTESRVYVHMFWCLADEGSDGTDNAHEKFGTSENLREAKLQIQSK